MKLNEDLFQDFVMQAIPQDSVTPVNEIRDEDSISASASIQALLSDTMDLCNEISAVINQLQEIGKTETITVLNDILMNQEENVGKLQSAFGIYSNSKAIENGRDDGEEMLGINESFLFEDEDLPEIVESNLDDGVSYNEAVGIAEEIDEWYKDYDGYEHNDNHTESSIEEIANDVKIGNVDLYIDFMGSSIENDNSEDINFTRKTQKILDKLYKIKNNKQNKQEQEVSKAQNWTPNQDNMENEDLDMEFINKANESFDYLLSNKFNPNIQKPQKQITENINIDSLEEAMNLLWE